MAFFRTEFHDDAVIQVRDLKRDTYWIYIVNCDKIVMDISAEIQWFAGTDGQQISLWEV